VRSLDSILILSGLILAPTLSAADAQAPETVEVLGFSGMLGFSASNDTRSVTFGGPQLGIRKGDGKLALSFFPSLIHSSLTDHKVRPGLGFGLEVSWGKYALFVPTYFINDRYRTTVGLGVRF
jgi:hypothetical protein